MARKTKLRAPATRASEEYNTSGENLATDAEVEQRVIKHTEIFHSNRNEIKKFFFDDNNLIQIQTLNANETLLKQSDFTFDENSNLTKIIKEIWNENQERFLKIQKDFIFNEDNVLTEIHSTKI